MAPSEQQKLAASAALQQSDNIAHALAGAGGGVLSMILTYSAPRPVPRGWSMLRSTRQIPSNYSVDARSG